MAPMLVRTSVTLLAALVAFTSPLAVRADVTRLPAVTAVRAPAAFATPILPYDGTADETSRSNAAVPGYAEPAVFAPFEPEHVTSEHIARATHQSLLSRMRRAASRILSAARNLPHF